MFAVILLAIANRIRFYKYDTFQNMLYHKTCYIRTICFQSFKKSLLITMVENSFNMLSIIFNNI